MAKADDSHTWFDLDLALMDDEALVVLAEECGYAPARDELIIRYRPHADRLTAWLAQSHGLSHADIEDARQNAVFWAVEAIEKYDTRQIGKAGGCSFRSFICRVMIARFKDFTKHLHRVEAHYDRSAHPSQEQEPVAGLDCTLDDPAALAESQESLTQLQESLARLDCESRRFWQLLAEGHSLRAIAAELGISYDAAKRRRRKLIEHLRLRLNPTG